MSSAPPPPPPAPSQAPPPVAVNVRWTRQAVREQRRAAAAATRQQRALYRAQLRASRRTSLLGPLLVVLVGLFLLTGELRGEPWRMTFGWLARWWPLVLVGSGLVLLVEWTFDTWRHASSPDLAYRRRSLGPGTALLLVLVTLAGLGETALSRGSNWMQRYWSSDLPEDWGLDQVLAQHSETDQEVSAVLKPGTLFTVQNYRGAITVTGTSQDGKVHASVHQRFVSWQSGELRRKQEANKPAFTTDDSGLLLRVSGQGRDEADLVIELPHEASLRIAAETGEVKVSELRGPLTVSDHKGNLELTALTGDVRITSADDDAEITGHSLSGTVALEGRSGNISLSDVAGAVRLHGDFFGTTHVERVSGPVHFITSYTDLSCASLQGELNVEGRNELVLSKAAGPVSISTSDRNLSLADIRGSATVRNRNGNVDLALADPFGPVDVSTADGSIHMHLPTSAAFRVTATTSDGHIENGFGLEPQQHDDQVLLTGQVRSGGPQIHLQTSDGDIKLDKGDFTRKGTQEGDADDSKDADDDR